MKSFTIHTNDRVPPRRWCWVRVHDTVEDLRRAAQRLNPKTSGDGWDEVCGCFQPTWTDTPSNYVGTLRLAHGWITAEIVAHELLHAALAVYRRNVEPDVRLGEDCAQREEDLAYVYGELFADLQDQLEAVRA